MYGKLIVSLSMAMLLVTGAKAQSALSWAKVGSGKTGYDGVPGKRICRTASEKDNSMLIGAAYGGTCHYHHYGKARKSQDFEYVLPPKGVEIRAVRAGLDITGAGLSPIKAGQWEWACVFGNKNIGYVWRNDSGTRKCYASNSSSENYKILVYGTSTAHANYKSESESYNARYTWAHGAFVKKHGVFSCKTKVESQADGCSVPKKFKDLNFEMPEEVPAFLTAIAEEALDGSFNDNDYNKFRNACNHHDACYRSPWFKVSGGKADCEKQFETDLQWKCDQVHDDGSPNWAICKLTASAMVAAVKDHGKKPFENGQKWSADNCTYP